MSTVRKVFLSGFIVALVGGHIWITGTGKKGGVWQGTWPIINYPMFAYLKTSWITEKPLIMGVAATNPHDEVNLMDPKYLKPFTARYLQRTFYKRTKSDYAELLRNELRIYEARRESGEFDGPKLNGIRLYVQKWRLNPNSPKGGQPISKRLIAEYEKPGGT